MDLRRPLAARWLPDLVAALCVALLATAVAHQYLNEHFDFSYRDCSEDLLYPCVGEFGRTIETAPLEASPHWQAFVQRKITAIDCGALRDLPRVDAGHTWDLQRYLHATLSAAFRARGPRRSVFVDYLTLMFGLTALAVYGLFRLGVSPLAAAAFTVPIIYSELHLQNLIHPIEYAKTPFMLACLFFLGLIVRRGLRPPALTAASVACGLSIGLGIGFKPDVLICLPIALVAIAGFAPRPGGAARRVLAMAALLGAVLAAGWPMLKLNFFGEWGSLLPVQVLGGTERSFARHYAQRSLYDYGVRFDDWHIGLLVNGYAQRVHGSHTEAGFYSREMQRDATLLLSDLIRTFPSDFLLRTWADVINVLKLNRVGVAAAMAVVPALFVADARLGGCVIFLLFTAVAYVSLVFQPKHFFHLEWVPWWFTAVAVEQGAFLLAAVIRQHQTSPTHPVLAPWPVARARAAMLTVGVLAAGAGFIWARHHQQRRVTALVDAYARMPAQEMLTAAPSAAEDGALTRTVPLGLGVSPHSTALVQDYLMLDVLCNEPRDADVVGIYQQATSPREPVTVPCSDGSAHWTIFWPIYQHPPESSFKWFEWSKEAPVRVVAIRRATDLGSLPLLVKLAVPDDFRRRAWYQVLLPDFYVDSLGVRPYLMAWGPTPGSQTRQPRLGPAPTPVKAGYARVGPHASFQFLKTGYARAPRRECVARVGVGPHASSQCAASAVN